MKKILFLLVTLLLFAAAGCEKENPTPTPMPKTDKVAAIFELSYGKRKKITYGNNQKIEISLQHVVDSVRVNCAVVQFRKPEYMLLERTHAYLKINKDAVLVKVSSKPCGALEYRNDRDNIQDVVHYINDEIIAAPAYEEADTSDTSYFHRKFVGLFGEGTPIRHTPLRIYMAKAFPDILILKVRDAQPKDYKFIFILTYQ